MWKCVHFASAFPVVVSRVSEQLCENSCGCSLELDTWYQPWTSVPLRLLSTSWICWTSLPGAWVPTPYPQEARNPQSLEASGLRWHGVPCTIQCFCSSCNSSHSGVDLPVVPGDLRHHLSLRQHLLLLLRLHHIRGSLGLTRAVSQGLQPQLLAAALHPAGGRCCLNPITLDMKIGTMYKSILLNWACGASFSSPHSDLCGY
ncbi:uncharacterized protein [Callorhinus ursinus]|uniref:uncharacterized protein n=1 Tax=Callorhinus ursinus TaxID=34884 RepID=UPI003CD040A3